MEMSSGNGVVVCSLEPWDDVWRRNQFLVDQLLCLDPSRTVLFVEPAYDLAHGVVRRERPPPTRPQRVPGYDHLWRLQPVKPLPRVLGPWSDLALRAQVRRAARVLGLDRPTLWLNDLALAPLQRATGWPTVYDVTDDWLVEEGVPERVRRRRRRAEEGLLADAEEVVVCSPGLAASRGRDRSVELIPNGVDTAHFTGPQPRPADLGAPPALVYVGTLQEERFDVELTVSLARSLPDATITLVGPDALRADSRAALLACTNLAILGPRPYAVVPAYLQHADVIVVPHLVNAFTEALDPIKAYECLAVGRPTVATPVAGFRELTAPVVVAPAEEYAEAVRAALDTPAAAPVDSPVVPSWADRAVVFDRVLARSRRTPAGSAA